MLWTQLFSPVRYILTNLNLANSFNLLVLNIILLIGNDFHVLSGLLAFLCAFATCSRLKWDGQNTWLTPSVCHHLLGTTSTSVLIVRGSGRNSTTKYLHSIASPKWVNVILSSLEAKTKHLGTSSTCALCTKYFYQSWNKELPLYLQLVDNMGRKIFLRKHTICFQIW